MFDMCERLDLRTTLAPVTSVDGDAARFFMGHFYEALAGGLTIAQAHRSAMLRLRTDLPHPAFWAPFLLTGDPDVGLIARSAE